MPPGPPHAPHSGTQTCPDRLQGCRHRHGTHTSNSRNDAVTGALVADPEVYALRPEAPAACKPTAVSVADICQATGSGEPSFHTFAWRSVVVALLLVTRIFRRSLSPAASFSPLMGWLPRFVVAPASTLDTSRVTQPVAETFAVAR